MKKIYFLLGFIVILGFILRFYQLGSVPVGLHRDEAFLGYNAYSVLKTGRDMSGDFLSIHFASFMYSPGGYAYFSIPFISIFGLSAFSIRFASAFFGSITVLVLFFLIKELFFRYKYVNSLGLLSAFLLAIAPWHINLSRTATDNIIVSFFVIVAIWLYLIWNRKKSLWLVLLSFFCFGITFFIYQAPRAFLPIFIPFIVIVFWNKTDKKKLWLIILLFIITTLIPLAYILKSPQLSLRLKTVSVFATSETQLVMEEQIREDGVKAVNPLISRAYHNKFLDYSGSVWTNYINHFSYDYIFTDAGYPVRYRVTNMGLLYNILLPLILLGIWMMTQKNKRESILLLGLLLIAPIGSALTFDDVPNLQRTVPMVIPLIIFAAYGLIELALMLSKRRILQISVYILFFVLILYSFTYYIHAYYIHGVLNRPWFRQEGYQTLVDKVNALLPNYKKAVITTRETAPTVFFLFYKPYDATSFQKQTEKSTLRDFDRINFDNYEFSQEECPLQIKIDKEGNKYITGEKGILYINSGVCKPVVGTKELDAINRSDNSPVFKILEVQ